MPVLTDRKKMTKEQLESIIPYILEIRRRDQQKDLKLLHEIKNTEEEEEHRKTGANEDEEGEIRLEQIKLQEEQLEVVRKQIQDEEAALASLQKEKLDIIEVFKKSLQKKHEQQLQQQQQNK